MNKKEREMPGPFEAIMVLIGGIFMMALLHGFYLAGVGIEDPATSLSSMQLKLFTVTGSLSIALVPWFFVRLRGYTAREMFRLNPVPVHMALLGAPIGLSLAFWADELGRIVELFFPMPPEVTADITRTVVAGSSGELLVLLLGVAVVAVVVEEALFRGFLQVVVEHHINATRAVIISTVAWTSLHMNLISPAISIPMLLSGFFSGYLAWRTNSIVLPVFIHSINNLLAVWYYNSDFEASLPWYTWNGHVSPILLVAALYVLVQTISYIDRSYAETRSSSSSNRGDASGG